MHTLCFDAKKYKVGPVQLLSICSAAKKKKKVLHGQQGQLRGSSSPYGTWSQQGFLDPIKLAYE